MLFRIILLFSLFLLVESVVIETPLGALRGAPFKSKNGKKVYAFKKVPFAAPPVGELRFQLPQEPSPWKGVRDATEYGPACMSNSSTSKSPQKWVDEDCLHLNIFTSEKCLESKCPVIFYIHGGGFNYDSAVMFEDDNMVNNFGDKDVVMVISAFRLGFTGLLSFADDNVVARNMPVHDIIRGLEFVQEYISYFGGNHRDVTLFGHSMGGATVMAISLSKKIDPNMRLFQKGVAMSGPIFGSFIYGYEWTLRNLTMDFAYRLGCSHLRNPGLITDRYIEETVDCLRTKDQFELLRVQREMEDEGLTRPRGLIQSDPLFNEDMTSMLINPPKRPIVLGSISKELDQASTTDHSVYIADSYAYQNPQKIGLEYRKKKNEGNLDFDHRTESQLIFCGNQIAADALAKSGVPVYMYSYENPRHPIHTDDLFYIMGVHPFEMDENEEELSVIYPELFLNFCKTGKPNEDWELYNPERKNYYHIDVNKETGLRPHNEDFYMRPVVNYWSNRSAMLDQHLIRQRQLERKKKSINTKSAQLDTNTIQESQANEEATESSSLWTYLLDYHYYLSRVCILMFFATAGYLVGRRQANSQLRGRYLTIEAANEKTPLFM